MLGRLLLSTVIVIAGTGLGSLSAADAELDANKPLSDAYRALFTDPESARQSERPYIQPQVQYAGAHSLQTTLRIAYSEQIIPADPTAGIAKDQRIKLRCYNGNMIGPTLRLRPGNLLAIQLQNDLPTGEQDGDCQPHSSNPNLPHGWNCTNLHTHGLHVSPEGIADNVFRQIAPQTSEDYEIQLGEKHVAGTFWYHAHKHGSVALQVTTGMAGALIVDGGLDDIAEIKNAFERLIVFQQLVFRPDPDKVVTPEPRDLYDRVIQADPPPADAADPVTVTLINGQLHPVIRVSPDSVERWRFIHAGIEDQIRVAVVKDDEHLEGPSDEVSRVPLYEIAVDGIPRGKIVPREWNVLYPAYRWDVLFKAPPEPGEYLLINETVPPALELREDMPGHTAARDQPVRRPQYLAKIVVEGPAKPMKLPHADDLAAVVPAEFASITDSEVLDPQTGKKRACFLEFAQQDGKFKVDGCEYQPDRIDRVAWLGQAEEWHLKAKKASHPFHIHVNPFQQLVVDDNNNVVDRIWRDTLFLSSKDPKPSVVRMRFREFTGKTVLHCHILDHEDQGMMENLVILPAGQPLGNLKVRVLCNDAPAPDCPANEGVGQGLQEAPEFQLADTEGNKYRVSQSLKRPLIAVFFRGMGCLHCVQQLQALRDAHGEFAELGIDLVAVSSDSAATLSEAYQSFRQSESALPFPLLADESHATFKAFGCYDEGPEHGTFLIAANRKVVWQNVGRQPFTDIGALLDECRRISTGQPEP